MTVRRAKAGRRQRAGSQCRRGLSLMEVILAIAILGMSMAIIGELVRIGVRSARDARDLATAQFLCESRMSEIAAGIFPSESMQLTPFEDNPDWLFSVESEPSQKDGLLSVRITVTADQPKQPYPVTFTLSRWMVDPAGEYSINSQESSTSGASSSRSSGS